MRKFRPQAAIRIKPGTKRTRFTRHELPPQGKPCPFAASLLFLSRVCSRLLQGRCLGTVLAHNPADACVRLEQALSLNGILASGVSTILANSAALRVVAENIANVNTPGYVRRVANMEVTAQGGQVTGVALSDIQRVTNNYLDSEVLAARSATA